MGIFEVTWNLRERGQGGPRGGELQKFVHVTIVLKSAPTSSAVLHKAVRVGQIQAVSADFLSSLNHHQDIYSTCIK